MDDNFRILFDYVEQMERELQDKADLQTKSAEVRDWLTHHRYHRRHRCPTFDDVTATLMDVRDDVMTGNHYKVQKEYFNAPAIVLNASSFSPLTFVPSDILISLFPCVLCKYWAPCKWTITSIIPVVASQ